MKQLSFISKPSIEYGGSLLKGRRKTERVLDSRKPIHLVLKTKSSFSLFKQKKILQKVLRKQAKRFGVKIYSESIQSDHWHICLKITNRRLYRGFIRALTGIIARNLGKGLWQLRPYTRIVSWGRDFLNVLDYLLLNQCEVSGVVPYAVRKRRRVIVSYDTITL
ncbi:transposase [bacterium]|nr:transposase [bacterium]